MMVNEKDNDLCLALNASIVEACFTDSSRIDASTNDLCIQLEETVLRCRLLNCCIHAKECPVHEKKQPASI